MKLDFKDVGTRNEKRFRVLLYENVLSVVIIIHRKKSDQNLNQGIKDKA